MRDAKAVGFIPSDWAVPPRPRGGQPASWARRWPPASARATPAPYIGRAPPADRPIR